MLLHCSGDLLQDSLRFWGRAESFAGSLPQGCSGLLDAGSEVALDMLSRASRTGPIAACHLHSREVPGTEPYRAREAREQKYTIPSCRGTRNCLQGKCLKSSSLLEHIALAGCGTNDTPVIQALSNLLLAQAQALQVNQLLI